MAARGRPAGRPELSAKTEQALTISEMLMGAIESPEHELTLNTFSAETAKRARGRRLSTVQNMTDAFAQFGMNQGDKIDRRGQILMYRELMKNLESSLREITRAGMYDAAIELRDRIIAITNSFEQLQLDTEQGRQEQERRNFLQAERMIKTKCKDFWAEERTKLDYLHRLSKADLRKSHRVQREQLETEIEITPKPIIKYSTAVLNWRNAERNLCKAQRFEEAKEVKKRADFLDDVETKEFEKKYAAKLQRQRDDLLHLQAIEQRKRRELIKHHEWKMKRATDHDKKITRWRMRNNNRDMAHFHHMDGLRKPDFSIKPVLPERANAQRTGSTHKGTIMLDAVATGRQAVAGLCSLHDFDAAAGPKLSGTTTYAWG